MNRLRAMLRKEFAQMWRDRMLLGVMVVLPIVQLLLLGFAVRTEVKHLPTVVFDQCREEASRELLDTFVGTGYYEMTYVATSFAQVEDYIASGKAKVGIVFPPDFARRLDRHEPAQLQVIVDASDTMAASSAISTAQLVGQLKSQEILAERIGVGDAAALPYDIRIRPWYNPDFVSDYNLIPGIMGVVITMTLIMLTSMAIVREKEQGTLEQLLVTPLRPSELILGKIAPYIVVGYMQITVALLVGRWIFEIPFAGHVLTLYLLTLPFILASLGLGIGISTVAKNQMQAMQMSFFVLLPSVLLSGFMFPREAMPSFFYYLSTVIPMTHYLQIIRGIMLKGIGWSYLWQPTLFLLAFAAVMLTFSVQRFRRILTR